jgi:anti-anti-sigma factor
MAENGLTITTESRGRDTVLVVRGELDLTTVGQLEDEAARALAACPARLVVDLAGLRFADCRGARALAAVIASRKCPVVVRAVRPRVRRVLTVTGIALQAGGPGRLVPAARQGEAGADAGHGQAAGAADQREAAR